MSNWLSRQNNKVKLITAFFINVAIVLIIDVAFNWMGVYEARRSVVFQLAYSFFMGIIFTFSFNWNLIKTVFSTKEENNNA